MDSILFALVLMVLNPVSMFLFGIWLAKRSYKKDRK